jgi:hypothetical protein
MDQQNRKLKSELTKIIETMETQIQKLHARRLDRLANNRLRREEELLNNSKLMPQA